MAIRPPSAWLVAAVALVAGAAVGAGGAVLHAVGRPLQVGDFRVEPVQPKGPVPRVDAPETQFAFGTVGTGQTGEHAFVIRNVGDAPLTLTKGATSCSCTFSDFESAEGAEDGQMTLEPGAETRVNLKWIGKGDGGPFRQQAMISTNDPSRPELALVIEGLVVPTWRATPSGIHLSRVSATTGDHASVTVITYGESPPTIESALVDHPEADRCFALTTELLDPATTAGEPGATGGVRLDLDVKPGLSPGQVRADIRLVLLIPQRIEIAIPIDGKVGGDLALAGAAWDSSQQVLKLGTVSGKTGFSTQLFLTARGPHRDAVRPVVREVVPEAMQVTIGDSTPIGSGGVVRTPITIVIPPGSRVANHLCSKQGPAGRIVLDTGHPDSPVLTIPVCVAIGP